MRASGCKFTLGLLLFVCAVAPAFANSQAIDATARSSSTDNATLTFRRVFKSSYPEFVEITVNEDGTGTYDIRQLDDTASPQPLQIGAPLVRKMFGLAGDLHDFENLDIDVHRRIANLGQKTFVYKNGPLVYRTTFNYTLNNTARQLLAIFEGLQRQELDLSDMERVMHYDHLGIADVIARVQGDVKNKLIPEPDALLPALDQIASDSELLDMSRQRARAIAEEIREKS